MIKLLIALILVLAIILSKCNADNQDDQKYEKLANLTVQDRLRHVLLINYVRTVIPSEHNQSVNLSLKLDINHFELDEEAGVSTLYGVLYVTWEDRKLKWNRNDFDDLESVFLSPQDIWLPDLAIYNNAENSLIDSNLKGWTRVDYRGRVTWSPQITFKSFCDLNHKNWPFDTQSCSFVMGSWTYNGFQLDMHLSSGRTKMTPFIENHQWKVTNIHSLREETIYACCAEPYIKFTFILDVERRSPMLKILVTIPALAVTAMALVCFWIPPFRGEKILLNGINLLIVVIIILHFAKKIPSLAHHIPLVVIFYTSSYILLTISMLVSVIVITITKNSSNYGKLPQFIKTILQSSFGLILGVSQVGNTSKSASEVNDHFEDGKSNEDHFLIKTENNFDDWLMLANCIDRIFFYCYSIIFFLLLLICFA